MMNILTQYVWENWIQLYHRKYPVPLYKPFQSRNVMPYTFDIYPIYSCIMPRYCRIFTAFPWRLIQWPSDVSSLYTLFTRLSWVGIVWIIYLFLIGWLWHLSTIIGWRCQRCRRVSKNLCNGWARLCLYPRGWG